MKKSFIQDIKKGGDTVIKITPKKILEIKKDRPLDAISISPRKENPHTDRRRIHSTPALPQKTHFINRKILIALVVLIIFVGGYYTAEYFKRTTITLSTKRQSLVFDHTPFTLSKDANAPIHFELMIVPSVVSKNMTLTESADVSIKATGVVTFYNYFSSKPVTIPAGSFLADPNGKNYKTDKSVIIPGFTTLNKVITPGKKEATITAFLPGKEYNGNPAKFTVTAYKGTTKFTKIYANAKGPISGGAQGLIYKLSSSEKGTLDALAESEFKNNLIKKANAQVPPGYIMYPTAYTYESHYDDNFSSATPEASVNIETTLSAVLVKKDDLVHALVKNKIPTISDTELSEVDMPSIDNLSFAFTTGSQNIDKSITTVSFNMTGEAQAFWSPNLVKIQNSLAGIPKSNLGEFFKQDPGIINANVSVFPPWDKTLPTDPQKIRIIPTLFDDK